MKNKDITVLLENFEKLKYLQGVEFAMFVARNLRLLRQEAEDIKTSNQPTPKFLEFDKKRVALCENFCNKDERGFPVMEEGRFIFSTEGDEAFIKAVEPIRKEYEDEIKKQEELTAEYLKFLEKDSILELYTINKVDLPADINAEQLDVIYDLIKEK